MSVEEVAAEEVAEEAVEKRGKRSSEGGSRLGLLRFPSENF